jgi:hypothetical protein
MDYGQGQLGPGTAWRNMGERGTMISGVRARDYYKQLFKRGLGTSLQRISTVANTVRIEVLQNLEVYGDNGMRFPRVFRPKLLSFCIQTLADK